MFHTRVVHDLQDCLQLTPEQMADMIRLRADCLAKQGENQAQWHQLCNAIADVRLTQMPLSELTSTMSSLQQVHSQAANVGIAGEVAPLVCSCLTPQDSTLLWKGAEGLCRQHTCSQSHKLPISAGPGVDSLDRLTASTCHV